jgi:aerobic carbon-monoxide dehydrogenase medium subunit
MKPSAFDYHDPSTVDEALQALASDEDARVLAGGQSLVPLLNLRLATPTALVDINGIAEFGHVEEHDGVVAVGAIVRQWDAEEDDLLRERCPLLTAALPYVGHPQIRSRGTVVGAIAHNDPAGELPAVALALDAQISVVSAARGARRVPAEAFFAGSYMTVLEPGELVDAVWFPASPPGTRAAFVEVARRAGDFALVGAGCSLTLAEGSVADARVVAVNVAPGPVRLRNLEDRLRGSPATPDAVRGASTRVAEEEGVEPRDDVHATGEYRKEVLPVLVERALVTALERGARERSTG